MFLGSYTPSFDPKSRRIALPKKIRDYLATSEIVLSLGFEKCIFGFDTPRWAKESAKQLEQSLADRSSRYLRRLFFSGAELIKLDDQGRFVIPLNLREYAQIARPVIIGAGDHFEIWESSRWLRQRTKLQRAIG